MEKMSEILFNVSMKGFRRIFYQDMKYKNTSTMMEGAVPVPSYRPCGDSEGEISTSTGDYPCGRAEMAGLKPP